MCSDEFSLKHALVSSKLPALSLHTLCYSINHSTLSLCTLYHYVCLCFAHSFICAVPSSQLPSLGHSADLYTRPLLLSNTIFTSGAISRSLVISFSFDRHFLCPTTTFPFFWSRESASPAVTEQGLSKNGAVPPTGCCSEVFVELRRRSEGLRTEEALCWCQRCLNTPTTCNSRANNVR